MLSQREIEKAEMFLQANTGKTYDNIVFYRLES
jgi:hypothetical protein